MAMNGAHLASPIRAWLCSLAPAGNPIYCPIGHQIWGPLGKQDVCPNFALTAAKFLFSNSGKFRAKANPPKPRSRVVNATLKKERGDRYRYQDLKVAALPLPLLKFKSSLATATSATATLPRNSYNKVANATGRRHKTKVPRRKAGVEAMANFTVLRGAGGGGWGGSRRAFSTPTGGKKPPPGGGSHIRGWQTHSSSPS